MRSCGAELAGSRCCVEVLTSRPLCRDHQVKFWGAGMGGGGRVNGEVVALRVLI